MDQFDILTSTSLVKHAFMASVCCQLSRRMDSISQLVSEVLRCEKVMEDEQRPAAIRSFGHVIVSTSVSLQEIVNKTVEQRQSSVEEVLAPFFDKNAANNLQQILMTNKKHCLCFASSKLTHCCYCGERAVNERFQRCWSKSTRTCTQKAVFKPEEQATDPELTDREKDLKLFIDLPGGVVTAPAINVGKKNLECQSQTSPIEAYLRRENENSNINWVPKSLQYPDLKPFPPKPSYSPISSASSASVPSYQKPSTSNSSSSNSDSSSSPSCEEVMDLRCYEVMDSSFPSCEGLSSFPSCEGLSSFPSCEDLMAIDCGLDSAAAAAAVLSRTEGKPGGFLEF